MKAFSLVSSFAFGLAALAFALVATPAAQSQPMIPQAAQAPLASPTAAQIVDQLTPKPHRTRGFTPIGLEETSANLGGTSRGLTVLGPHGQPRAQEPDPLPAIDLTINFDFGSANLTRDGMALVETLSRALKDPRLAGRRFLLEGHTDSVGSAEFNQKLSEERARTVRETLAKQYGVPAERLDMIGFGWHKLLDPENPTSGLNRRVRVVNLG